MKDHSSSSSHSRSRSRRYYDKKRSRSRSRERSHRRRSHSPKDRNDKNKTMSEKLKKTIQKQLIDAKTDIKNMIAISDKQSIQPTNDIKIESLSFDDQLKRANEIQDIKSSDFEPKNFISAKTLATLSLTEIPLPSSLNWRENPELVLHPNVRIN